MMKAVWLDGDTVANVSLWDENSNKPEGATIEIVADNAHVGIGFTRNEDGTFSAPPQDQQ